MDAGNGNFVTAPTLKDLFDMYPGMKEKFDAGQYAFTVGQEIEVMGSLFKVKSIGKKFMKLELLPQRDGMDYVGGG